MQQFIEQVLRKNDFQVERLLMILRDIQDEYQCISKEAIELLATLLKIERTQIISVVEFYSFFHLSPRGKYDVLFSDSITDIMLGKPALMAYFSDKLNVLIGAVRADGLVSLNNTGCTGLCDQGPAILVNGRAIADLSEQKIDQVAALIEQKNR